MRVVFQVWVVSEAGGWQRSLRAKGSVGEGRRQSEFVCSGEKMVRKGGKKGEGSAP